MNILVQKFGGSSMATPARRELVIGHIKEAKAAGYRIVVVVSAMGRSGEPYATDTLLQLVDHGKGMDPRDLDLLMSCGEIISAAVLVSELIRAGQRAAVLTGGQAGILTDDVHGTARIIEVKPDRVLEYLNRGVIPVVAGFQGTTREGEITTLGRGSGDTSAVALGVALRAEMVEIYTDVDGLMTADPRVEPHARRLETVTYREIAEMAHLGAKVIHPRAVEIAMEGHIPLRIRATGSSSPGTLVHSAASQVVIRGDRVVTGIAHVGGMVQVQLETVSDFNRSELGLAIFQGLAKAGISLDMIYVSPNRISFILEPQWAEQAENILRNFPVGVQIEHGMAKVSAVGAGMRGVPGVMARVVSALQQAGVTIYQTTDSHANISCLVRETDVEAAVHALHSEFQLSRPET